MKFSDILEKKIYSSYVQELYEEASAQNKWEDTLTSLVLDLSYGQRENTNSILECDAFARQFAQRRGGNIKTFKYKKCSQFFHAIDVYRVEKADYLLSQEDWFVAHLYLTRNTGVCYLAEQEIIKRYIIYREALRTFKEE